MQGRARFQTANALAATAAARALDVGIPEIADALMEFRNDRDNPGRMNLFSVQGRSVLIDYGHNPAALQGICDVVRTWPTGRAIAVFGLPGDRSDDLLRDSAKVLGCGFQEVILREDQDLRGRQPGELPHMLQEVIRSTHPNLPTEIVPDEIEALDRALERSSKSDLLVLLCEKPDRAIAHLHSLGAIADDGAEAWSAAGLLSER
jgi:cyanophycin synthetase